MSACERDANAKPAEVLAFYRRQASIYDLTRWLTLRGRHTAIAALQLEAGQSVLDLGCGTGLAFSGLAAGVGAQGTVLGVDFSPHMLEIGRRRIQRHGLRNVSVIQADLTTLSLHKQFDAVACFYSLSMIADWETALACASRHVSQAGRIVVLDFGWLTYSALRAPYERWLRANWTQPGRPYSAALGSMFSRVQVRSLLGGYVQIVTATGGNEP